MMRFSGTLDMRAVSDSFVGAALGFAGSEPQELIMQQEECRYLLELAGGVLG